MNPTITIWNTLAKQYQEKFMDLTIYDEGYDKFCDRIVEKGARIFEIGCGPGNISRYLLKKRPDFILEATDAAPTMVTLAQTNVPAASFRVLDAKDLSTVTTKYHGIVIGFCMPYLTKEECVQLISDCSEHLLPGGILYFSTIEGRYADSALQTSSDGKHTMMVYLHEAEYLYEALAESGMSAIESIRVNYGKDVHLAVLASKENGTLLSKSST